ncbi:unnamed protein product, partial [Coregonus sp. 'balchen']
MSGLRTILISTGLVGVVGIGYGMWSVIQLGEERKRIYSKLRMEESRKRNGLMMQVLKEAAETNDNIARGLGPRSKK